MLTVPNTTIKFPGGATDGFLSGLMIECGTLNENSILQLTLSLAQYMSLGQVTSFLYKTTHKKNVVF